MLIPNNICNSNSKSKLKSYILVCAVFIVMILSGYWLKCQMGIGFFENYSLSKYVPFKYLVPNNVIENPLPGIILDDSFDSFSLFGNWTDLWMREKGKVTKEHDSYGLNSSRCLVIKSTSSQSWSCSYKKYIRVKKGDTFIFKVSVKLSGDKLSAYAGIAIFDETRNVTSWNYISENVDIIDDWVTVERTFIIHEEISYIRFKLSGTGAGEFRFDNVIFKMLKI